jgi:hypothetical protein
MDGRFELELVLALVVIGALGGFAFWISNYSREKRERRWWKFVDMYDLWIDVTALILFLCFCYGPVNVDRFTQAFYILYSAIALAFAVCLPGLTARLVFRDEITPGTFVLFGFRLFELVLFFAAVYRLIGITSPGGRAQTFGPCLYFSIITITTVGYGDWYPLPQARVFAASEALIGYAFMGLLIAALTNLLGKKQPQPPKRRRGWLQRNRRRF